MAAQCRYSGGMAKVTIRIPDELHDDIKELADRSRRSLNSEIVWLLEQALTQQEER